MIDAPLGGSGGCSPAWPAAAIAKIERGVGHHPLRRALPARSRQQAESGEEALDEARTSLYRSVTAETKGGVRVNRWGGVPPLADTALSALSAGLTEQLGKAITGKKPKGVVAALTDWFGGDKTKDRRR